MDRPASQEDGNDALWGPEGMPPVFPMMSHLGSKQEQDLAYYQSQLKLLEEQNKRRLLLARAEKGEASGRSSATTLAQPINVERLEAVRSETMEASGESSIEISAQQEDNNNHVGAQKRKRGNNDEGRPIQSGDVSSTIISGEPSLHNIVDLVRDKDQQQLPPHFDLIYQVTCDQGDPSSHPAPAFRDVPIPNASWPVEVQGDSSKPLHFNGNVPIFDLEAFLNDETSNAAFVVVRTIECSISSIWMAHANVPLRSIEKIYAKSRTSKIALQRIAKCHFQSESKHEHDFHRGSSKEVHTSEAPHPHVEIAPLKLFLYHLHSTLRRHNEDQSFAMNQISGLLQYSEARYGKDFKEAEALIENQGLVSQEHILKLYRPNDLVVGEIHGQPSAFVVQDWPQVDERNWITLMCWSYQTDGFGFARKLTVLSIPPLEADFKEISALIAYPLRFATNKIQETIRLLGQKQWSFRKATQVVYKGWNVKHNQYYPGSRFMIDYKTYHKMHEDAATFMFDKLDAVYSCDEMPVYLNPEDSPSQTLLSLLSPTIHGFDLSEKRWIHLRLDSVHAVSWNKKAYDQLAIPDQTKYLMRTLVFAQKSQSSINEGIGAARIGADIIARKGNGLTVLLHGGPGTGKTLTAESVAEIAEMPLYRVVCGDIRTNVDAVESDLAFFLHLGKAWNCVLLFEEAHVFERHAPFVSKSNFFSSLLQILEYYNGIVIMTSSRFHAFDQAIISRVQFPLHLGNLNPGSRKKIWQNFIDLFEADRGNANFEEIRLHLDDLARKELNGHQIRNVFKTGKELAMVRYERFDWEHLVQALSLLSDFTTACGTQMAGE